jgi:hypothetical protein
MSKIEDRSIKKSIKTGDISGTGIAVGHGAQASVTITQESRNEILNLLKQLRDEIQKSAIPDGAKSVLLNKAVPEMEKAVQSDKPKSGLEQGLERINDQLEGAGAVASTVSGIVETVTKIAKSAGIAIKVVAPFLSALF